MVEGTHYSKYYLLKLVDFVVKDATVNFNRTCDEQLITGLYL